MTTTDTSAPRPAAVLGRGLLDRLGRFEPSMLLWLALIALLLFLVVNPIARLLISSFTDVRTGDWTLANYVTAYGRPRHVQALINTLYMGAGVVVLSTLFAVPLAWACSRTDMPGRNLVRLIVLGAFITPPYLGAVGWILLAGPNAGWINQVWMSLTGDASGIVNVFSFGGLVLVISTNVFFFIFVFTTNALDMISSEMEDAANVLGAGTLRTVTSITLPLVFPAILGGMIVTFLQAIALFGVPALISLPARFPVVTTQLWQFFEFPVRVQVAAAYAIPLLLITMAMFGMQKLILRRKGFVSLTGKGGERRLVKLGPWRWVMLGYAVIIGILTLVAPFTALTQAAFSHAWGRGMSWDNFTVTNFTYLIFDHNLAMTAIVNSILFAAAAAFLALAIALAIAYIVDRKIVPFGGLLAFICMAPFVIPGVVLAIGFYAAYAPPPLALYGTSLILIFAFAARFLPVAYANSAAGMRSINHEMEEAVRILGGGRLTAIRRVTAPLLKRTLAGGWLLIFIPAAQELSTAVFLTGPRTQVISVLLLDMSEEGNLEHLAALGMILLVLTILIVVVGMRLLGRDFMLRRT